MSRYWNEHFVRVTHCDAIAPHSFHCTMNFCGQHHANQHDLTVANCCPNAWAHSIYHFHPNIPSNGIGAVICDTLNLASNGGFERHSVVDRCLDSHFPMCSPINLANDWDGNPKIKQKFH